MGETFQTGLDLSASVMVIISLVFLFRKSVWYWHFSNLSVFPYFALFMVTQQFMLAGLQVSYLIFGVHGLYLWILEHRRDHKGRRFNEVFWYNLGWVLTLCIFAYSVTLTKFADLWSYLQFAVTAMSLVANWGTTRKWLWSWRLWIVVNASQAILFWHLHLWYQVALQFILAAMSIKGLIEWRKQTMRDIATP